MKPKILAPGDIVKTPFGNGTILRYQWKDGVYVVKMPCGTLSIQNCLVEQVFGSNGNAQGNWNTIQTPFGPGIVEKRRPLKDTITVGFSWGKGYLRRQICENPPSSRNAYVAAVATGDDDDDDDDRITVRSPVSATFLKVSAMVSLSLQ